MMMTNSAGIRVPHEERAQLWYRFQPFDGDIVLQPGMAEWPASFFVLESSVFETPAGVEMWFTVEVQASPERYCIARAVATDINSAFVVDDYYIGNGRGGTAAGDYYQGGYGWYDSGTYWMIATNGYGVFTGGTGKAHIFSTTNLASGFTDHGIILQQSDFAAFGTHTALGNVALVFDTNNIPVQIGGLYYALAECFKATYWRTYVATSSSLTGPWTVSHELTTAQPVASAMYGGMWAMLIGSTIHFAYHYGSIVGDLPTLLAYATSTDNLATATIRESPFAFYNPFPYGSLTDQSADPWFVQIGGSSYLFYEICANFTVNGFESYIVKKSFPGTLEQAFDDIRKS